MTAHGSVDVGYRLQDVDGNRDTFRELFDFSDGPRVFGIDFRAVGGSATNRPFDTLTFNATGLGDPFPTVQLAVRRSRRYDVRASWRRIPFFDVAPLTPASIDGFDTQAVTDHHSWSTSRQLGSVSATVQAGRQVAAAVRLRPHVQGRRGRLDAGHRLHRLAVDVGKLRPGESVSGLGTGRRCVEPLHRWSLVLGGSAGRSTTGRLPDRDGHPLARSALRSRAQHQCRRPGDRRRTALHGRLVAASQRDHAVERAVVRRAPRVEHRVARRVSLLPNDGTVQPRRRRLPERHGPRRPRSRRRIKSTIAADGDGEMPYHVVGQGFTYRRSSHWAVDVDYRFSRMTSESTGDLTSVLSDYGGATAPVSTREVHELSWRENLNTIRASVLFQPTTRLSISPGVRFARRDVAEVEDGVEQPATTNDENTVTPELSIAYRPAPWVGLRVVFRHTSNDAPYTRMSPSERSIVRVIASFEPAEGVDDSRPAPTTTTPRRPPRVSSRGSMAPRCMHRTRSNKRLTAFGSVDYRDLLALGDTTFLRGTAPITDLVMRDAETDTVWQGGATVQVTQSARSDRHAASIRASRARTKSLVNRRCMVRMRFPFGTISVSYDVPRVGTAGARLSAVTNCHRSCCRSTTFGRPCGSSDSCAASRSAGSRVTGGADEERDGDISRSVSAGSLVVRLAGRRTDEERR